METLEEKSDLLGLQTENMEQPFSVSALKKLVAIPDHTDISVTPEERVRALSKLGSNITINEDITPRRYFRSGVEMERMASVYMEEGNLENAFVFYNKFITLFVEKLPSHRDYHQCAIPEKQDIIKCSENVTIFHMFQNKCKTELLKKLEHQKLIEAEKKRIAHMRQQQLESEQFQFFEDQLKKQELARDQKIKESVVMSEQIDGSMLSCISVPENSSLSTALLEKKERSGTSGCTGHSPPVNQVLKPAATLSAVQSKCRNFFSFFYFICLFAAYSSPHIAYAYTMFVLQTHNEFTITHVIVPKQSAGPDYCDMENVEELFGIQDQYDLLTLGWIHTHPTQTAFLSSVDLHTHCSYQLMLPEAIAIVCSPKHNDTGIFRLTNAGMLEVSSCKKKGFHPHTKDPRLFNPCTHVVGKDIKIIVLDLR
ncbi:STALP protease, partial [Corythaeola cristata]|nr:STALP protease [Corythaeola cristata]